MLRSHFKFKRLNISKNENPGNKKLEIKSSNEGVIIFKRIG